MSSTLRRGFSAAAILAVLGPFSVSCSKSPPTGVDYSKTPVLFVHGSGMDAGVWKDMISSLVKQGYPRKYLLAINLSPKSGSNRVAAEKYIGVAVDRLLDRAATAAERAGASGAERKVDLVSHSMGAASSRWYTAKIAPETVRTWISIAGSNHGSEALRGFDFAGDLEMVPAFATTSEESSFQVLLNGTPEAPRDETPFGVGRDSINRDSIPPDSERRVSYYSIYIDPDFFIKPEESAVLDGAGGVDIAVPEDLPVVQTSPGNFLLAGNRDHDSLPKDRDVIRLVSLLLEAVPALTVSFSMSDDW